MERKLKVHKPALAIFDGLLGQVLRLYGEGNVEAKIFPINSSKSGIIFSSDGEPVQAFTVDANGKNQRGYCSKKEEINYLISLIFNCIEVLEFQTFSSIEYAISTYFVPGDLCWALNHIASNLIPFCSSFNFK